MSFLFFSVIDLSSRRADPTFTGLTMKSLEKWRRVSATASIPELVSTLRRLKKQQIVRKIQRQVMQSNTI